MSLHTDTTLLLIDCQTSFFDQMHGAAEPVLVRLERLLGFARMVELPVIATLERSVVSKGSLPERLDAAFPADGARFEKDTFDCTANEAIRDALADRRCRHVAVAGAETDVCVLLSVLGLLQMGYRVFLLEDCVFSSEANPGAALRRMETAGAVPTTFKSFAYEIAGTVDRSHWPSSWRERVDLFPPPEDLPNR